MARTRTYTTKKFLVAKLSIASCRDFTRSLARYNGWSCRVFNFNLNLNYCFLSVQRYLILIRPFHVFVVEPILSEGCPDFVILDDGWTCVSYDGSRLVVFI